MNFAGKAFIAFVLLISPAYGATLVYQTTCPAPAPSDPAYLAGIAALQSAIDSGSRLHISMSFKEADGSTSYFYSEITAAKSGIDSGVNYINGLIPQRPIMNGDAKAARADGISAGSVSGLSVYSYAPYFFGTAGPTPTTDYSCYVVKWWAD